MVLEQGVMKRFTTRDRTRRLFLRLGLSTAALCLGGWVSFTIATAGPSSPTDVYNGVDQVALQKCMAQSPPVNCESTVPGLAQCMQQGLSCNRAGEADRNKNFGPARPVTDFGPQMTQGEAVAASLASNPPTARTVAREMTYGNLVTLAGQQPDGGISLSRMVWVVTVHGSLPTKGNAHVASQTAMAYTVVIDAASRQVIEIIFGDKAALLG